MVMGGDGWVLIFLNFHLVVPSFKSIYSSDAFTVQKLCAVVRWCRYSSNLDFCLSWFVYFQMNASCLTLNGFLPFPIGRRPRSARQTILEFKFSFIFLYDKVLFYSILSVCLCSITGIVSCNGNRYKCLVGETGAGHLPRDYIWSMLPGLFGDARSSLLGISYF